MAVFQLTNLQTLKTRLAVKGNKSDGALRQLLRTISGHIAHKVNRADALLEQARTEIFDMEPEQTRFPLRAAPVASVTSVRFDPLQDFPNGTVIDAANFVVDPKANALVLLFNMIPAWSAPRPQSLEIIYTGGFADLAALRDSKYADLEEGTILQIQHIWKRRRTTPGKVNLSGQGGSVNMQELNLTPLVKEIIKPMRRKNLGR